LINSTDCKLNYFFVSTMPVDPITGLPSEDSSQETTSSGPLRPQSPLVRGSHLDRSVDRTKKRSNLTTQVDNDNLQLPAQRGELQGLIPRVFAVVHLRERLDHIGDVVQCVIEGKEEFITEQELLLIHPPNLEKTRFSMSRKKLKLQFIDDILDRVEEDRYLDPDLFDRRRKKLWHKSVTRSLKFINKFLDKEVPNGKDVQPKDGNESVASTNASTVHSKRGRPKTKVIAGVLSEPKKTIEEGEGEHY
ncbi:hypothetical protein PMAYCL1PPCAC_18366, partial [Pristionchus mayeri]